MKTKLYLATLILFLSIFSSCKKTAGTGGNASIKGKILEENWNKYFTVKNGEYPGTDVDVYIIYGDNVTYSDKTKSNYNGEFEFKYLRKGKYKIYVYSKDKTLTSVSGQVSVVKDAEITKNKQTVEVEQFTIYN